MLIEFEKRLKHTTATATATLAATAANAATTKPSATPALAARSSCAGHEVEGGDLTNVGEIRRWSNPNITTVCRNNTGDTKECSRWNCGYDRSVTDRATSRETEAIVIGDGLAELLQRSEIRTATTAAIAAAELTEHRPTCFDALLLRLGDLCRCN